MLLDGAQFWFREALPHDTFRGGHSSGANLVMIVTQNPVWSAAWSAPKEAESRGFVILQLGLLRLDPTKYPLRPHFEPGLEVDKRNETL